MKIARHLLSCLLGLAPSILVAAEKPNIIIIYADDIGYGDFSCYGEKGVSTPNIDAIARQGVRHMSGYSAAATCTPSRYSLLVGEYAFRNKEAAILPGNAPLIMDTSRPSLASFLRDNGYATGLVGKWHLGLGAADQPLDWNAEIKPGPTEVGFDESFYMAATADRVPSVFINNGRVVNLDPKDPITVNYEKMVGDWPTGISHPQLLKVQADEQHSGTIVNGVSRIGFMTGGKSALFKDEDMADTYLKKAQEFISTHAQNVDKGLSKPFFLYYAPNENHVPRVVHQRFQGSTGLGPRGDAVAAFDWCIGALVKTLKAKGIYENTLIVISSDNGPVLFDGYWDGAIEKAGNHKAGGIWRGGKYSRWEAGTRVPFIVSWPNKVKAGVSDALVSQVDLFASFAEMIGVKVPKNAAVDSENVLPALLGHSQTGRDYVIQEALTQIAVRKGNWKYLPSGSIKDRGDIGDWIETEVGDQGFLFNLREDPNERHNVAGLYPEIVAEMNAIIRKVAPEKASGAKNINKKQLGF